MFIQSEGSSGIRIDFHNGYLDINIQEVEDKITETGFRPESTITSSFTRKSQESLSRVTDKDSKKPLVVIKWKSIKKLLFLLPLSA